MDLNHTDQRVVILYARVYVLFYFLGRRVRPDSSDNKSGKESRKVFSLSSFFLGSHDHVTASFFKVLVSRWTRLKPPFVLRFHVRYRSAIKSFPKAGPGFVSSYFPRKISARANQRVLRFPVLLLIHYAYYIPFSN